MGQFETEVQIRVVVVVHVFRKKEEFATGIMFEEFP